MRIVLTEEDKEDLIYALERPGSSDLCKLLAVKIMEENEITLVMEEDKD